MSRIFDALQQSKSEGEGFEFPLISSLAIEKPPAEITEAPKVDLNVAGEVVDITRFHSLTISPSPENRLVCLTDQASLSAEKFRFLGVRLRQLQQTRPLKTLLITSTIPEEGKSLVSANLAIALAQRRQRVLLIDGDLRRPSLSGRFNVARSLPGLSEWLQRGVGAINNIYQLEEGMFWFLPAGGPPDQNLDLIQPRLLSELMNHLRGLFDWILIDSPPVIPLADTSVWMRSADGILLVAREGKTQKRQLKRGLLAIERLKLLGVVLNGSTNTEHDNYYQRYITDPQKAQAKSRIDKQNSRSDRKM
jgi:capsular exopolysaccharide synthesis family protein